MISTTCLHNLIIWGEAENMYSNRKKYEVLLNIIVRIQIEYKLNIGKDREDNMFVSMYSPP